MRTLRQKKKMKKNLKVPKSINGTQKKLFESKLQKAKHNLNDLVLGQKQSHEFRNCPFQGNDDDIDFATLLNTEFRVHKMLVMSNIAFSNFFNKYSCYIYEH